MEVKPGYKQSEVGVIPEDWDVSRLGEIGEALIGLTYQPSDVRESGTLVLRSSNVQKSRLAFDDNVFVVRDVPEKIMVRSGDILICVRNGSRDLIGKSAYLDARAVGMTFGAFMAVFRSPLSNYLIHQFRSGTFLRQVREHLGATINQITNASLKAFHVALPPTRAEKDAIAGALLEADALIESLEQLVAKKQQIKHGAMQELLTGRKRLPGFTSKWETKTLGMCGEVIMGQSPPGASYNNDGLGSPLINGPTEFTDRYPIKIQWTTAPARFCKPGDLLICVRGSSTGRTNYADDTYAIGRGVAAIRASGDNNTEFMSYQVVAGVSAILAAATGSTFPSVDGASFRKIPIPLPTPAEQSAIATVLSDMDGEIAAFEGKLAKAQQVKVGMMQELLTGRIRLL